VNLAPLRWHDDAIESSYPTLGSRLRKGVMHGFRFTLYFEREVLRKRPYLSRELCVRVVRDPIRVEQQGDDRVRFWAILPELGGRALRVVTLGDRQTIHNAFLDRGFRP
jgi:hypothetical protein